ncbi:MAG: hypothetical protein WDW36_005981 [Sanguina aurantia]
MTPFSEEGDGDGLEELRNFSEDGCDDMMAVEEMFPEEDSPDDAVSAFLPGSQPSVTLPRAPKLSPPGLQSPSRTCTPSQLLSRAPSTAARTSSHHLASLPPRPLGPPASWVACDTRQSPSMLQSQSGFPSQQQTQQQQTQQQQQLSYRTTSSPSLSASLSSRRMNQVQPMPAPAPAPVLPLPMPMPQGPSPVRAQATPPTPRKPSPSQSQPRTASVPTPFASGLKGAARAPAVRAPCVVRVADPASVHAAKSGLKIGFLLNGELPWQLASQWVAMPIITCSWLVDLNQK